MGGQSDADRGAHGHGACAAHGAAHAFHAAAAPLHLLRTRIIALPAADPGRHRGPWNSAKRSMIVPNDGQSNRSKGARKIMAGPSLLTLAVLCGLAAPPAAAQQAAYPSKPITIIIGNPPGAPLEIYSRFFADRLRASLKQPVLVDF